MDPVLAERESLRDLKGLLERARQYNARILVMGGWAVSAFVGRHRYTKDIDLISTKEARGALNAAMKELGYKISNRSFGFKGIRDTNEMEIKLDVASLVLFAEDQVRPVAIGKRVAKQHEDVRIEFRARLQDLAARYRDAAFRNEWQAELGRRLSDADIDRLSRFLSDLDRLL